MVHSDTYIRAVTVELCCIVLRRLLLALESDEFFHSAVEEAVRRSVAALMVQLRSAVFAENLFLEMFESEYYQLQVGVEALKEIFFQIFKIFVCLYSINKNEH